MLKAIIVDDEPMSVKRFSRILQKTGLAVLVGSYTDPEEALENAAADQADVAFVDIEMPGMNGLVLTEKLQEMNPLLDVIMVTAHDHYALEAFKAHAVGYILKPAAVHEVTHQLTIIRAKRERYQDKEQPGTLNMKTFGQFQCYLNEKTPVYFTWRTAKAKELAAFLHHHQGNPVSRDTILDTLWPDMDLDRGMKNFHATSYYLREALKEKNLSHLVERLNGMYRLKWDEINSDEKRFIQLKKLLDEGKAGVEDLKKLTMLHTGLYCSEEDYAWADVKRIAYERAFHQALNNLINLFEEKGDSVEMVNAMQQFIQAEPYEESMHERLIDILLSKGDKQAAYAHFQGMKRVFQEELGVDPPAHLLQKIGRF